MRALKFEHNFTSGRIEQSQFFFATRGDEAFALRKGDPDALNFFSNWILVNTANGWLKDRHDYWFTTRDWDDLVEVDQ